MVQTEESFLARHSCMQVAVLISFAINQATSYAVRVILSHNVRE